MRVYVYQHPDRERYYYSTFNGTGLCLPGWWRDARLLYAIRYKAKAR